MKISDTIAIEMLILTHREVLFHLCVLTAQKIICILLKYFLLAARFTIDDKHLVKWMSEMQNNAYWRCF